MKRYRGILKSDIAPDDVNTIWIDSSTDAYQIKVFEKDHWITPDAQTMQKVNTLILAANQTLQEAKTKAAAAETKANEASQKATAAESSASTASTAATTAQSALASTVTKVDQIKAAIEALPDGQAVSATVAEHTVKITNLESEVGDINDTLGHLVTKGKNLISSTENGYVLNNNSLTETSNPYYRTTNFIRIKNGQKVIFSIANSFLFKVYVGKSEDSTTTDRLQYFANYTDTASGRYYAVYTATEDCVARMSFANASSVPPLPMVEVSSADAPSEYEPYALSINDDVVIPDIASLQSQMGTKVSFVKSPNVGNFINSGYVSIQNILADANTDGYKTSDWVTLSANESIIFSSDQNFCRLYVGRNTNPTTSGGSRITYITAFDGTSADGRKFVKYTATENCYIRASVYRSSQKPMIERTSADNPSAYKDFGDKIDSNIIIPLAESAKGITDDGLKSLVYSHWYGKKVLVLGDSLTAANVWQTKLASILGMVVTTHAKGGIGFTAMLDGSGNSSDSVSQASGTLEALSVNDVQDKDLIIIFGGYNHRGSADGVKGDLYPTVNSVYGCLQYLINGIYSLLTTANNLTCRIAVITPHCAGRYSYIPYTWDEEYPSGSGRTGETLVEAIKTCAKDNRIVCLDLFHTSGISSFTWNKLSASDSAYDGSGNVRDQLHLNSSYGYPYLGKVISDWVDTI